MSQQSEPAAHIISVPKGGGALSGIGETFHPNLFSGIGNVSLPIATSPGRSGEYRKCKRPFPPPVCLCPPAARQAAPRSRPAAGSRRIALPRCQARTSRQPGDGPPAPLGLLLGLPGRMVARGRPLQRDCG